MHTGTPEQQEAQKQIGELLTKFRDSLSPTQEDMEDWADWEKITGDAYPTEWVLVIRWTDIEGNGATSTLVSERLPKPHAIGLLHCALEP